MAQTSRAWVLDVGAGQHAAAGAPHVVEYLLATETVPVPRTPPHCRGLLLWRGRMIPVLDLAPLVAESATAATATRRAVVLAWQERPGEPLQYGALLVTAAPGETWVSDDMAGDLAAAPAAVRHFARAGFMAKDRLIPILDVRRLFGRALPAELFGPGLGPESGLHRIDAAPVAKAEPQRAVAEGIPTRQTLTTAIDLPALTPAAETPEGVAPAEIPHAVPSAVVIPFSAGKAELRQNILLGALHAAPEAAPAPAPEVPIPGEPLPLDEQTIVAEEMDAVEATLLAIDEPSAAVPIRNDVPVTPPPRFGTIESFERLRAIEEKAIPFQRDWKFRRRVKAIALGLVVLSAAYLTIAYYLSAGVTAPQAVPRPVLRDAGPGDIDPHSIPATPAQPPK